MKMELESKRLALEQARQNRHHSQEKQQQQQLQRRILNRFML
jgi:hypothetical protein